MTSKLLILFFISLIFIGCLDTVISNDIDRTSKENEGYYVKVIYFKPTDISDSRTEDIRKTVIEVQDFYGKELERYGYGYKTFKLEIVHNDVNINIIEAEHETEFYLDDARNLMFDEIGVSGYDSGNIIHVIVIGGVRRIEKRHGGSVYGSGKSFRNKYFGGLCIVAENSPIGLFNLLIHEIGHTLGLYHTLLIDHAMHHRELKPVLMEYEVRWLDKHYFFNNLEKVHADLSIIDLHRILNLKLLEYTINDDGSADLEFNIKSKNGLHQILVVDYDSRFSNVVGYKYIDGNDINIKMNTDPLTTKAIRCILMDRTGIYSYFNPIQ